MVARYILLAGSQWCLNLRASETYRLKKLKHFFSGTLVDNLTISKEYDVIKQVICIRSRLQ
jgi:hypothetical protein